MLSQWHAQAHREETRSTSRWRYSEPSPKNRSGGTGRRTGVWQEIWALGRRSPVPTKRPRSWTTYLFSGHAQRRSWSDDALFDHHTDDDRISGVEDELGRQKNRQVRHTRPVDFHLGWKSSWKFISIYESCWWYIITEHFSIKTTVSNVCMLCNVKHISSPKQFQGLKLILSSSAFNWRDELLVRCVRGIVHFNFNTSTKPLNDQRLFFNKLLKLNHQECCKTLQRRTNIWSMNELGVEQISIHNLHSFLGLNRFNSSITWFGYEMIKCSSIYGGRI